MSTEYALSFSARLRVRELAIRGRAIPSETTPTSATSPSCQAQLPTTAMVSVEQRTAEMVGASVRE